MALPEEPLPTQPGSPEAQAGASEPRARLRAGMALVWPPGHAVPSSGLWTPGPALELTPLSTMGPGCAMKLISPPSSLPL